MKAADSILYALCVSTAIITGCSGTQPTVGQAPASLTAQTDGRGEGFNPRILGVTRILNRQTQTFRIFGKNFGANEPYFGDSGDFWIYDLDGNWRAGCGAPWGNCGVTINVNGWSDSQIVVGGFGGTYGKFTLKRGDPLVLFVWNARTGKGPAAIEAMVK